MNDPHYFGRCGFCGENNCTKKKCNDLRESHSHRRMLGHARKHKGMKNRKMKWGSTN